jgi:hypothetical protein
MCQQIRAPPKISVTQFVTQFWCLRRGGVSMTDTALFHRCIDRAVDLWCRALRSPRFDNGDQSQAGFYTMALATMNSDNATPAQNEYEAAIERFRVALTSDLKGRAWDQRPYEFLGCDYNPDKTLAKAAQLAGVPLSNFSWKSDVILMEDYVRAKWGYGAPDWYHYPLPDGRWMVCQLSGESMPAIIAAVLDGRLPEITVEPAA